MTNKRGFTLIEVLVSIFIFGIISVALVNIFVSAIKSQSRILQNQELMEQSSYALDYMAKALRMAKKDVDGFCVGTSSSPQANFSYGIGTNSIRFLIYDTGAGEYRCRQFIYDSVNYSITEKRSSNATSDGLSTAVTITSNKVKVNNLNFGVSGNGSDTLQPKITVAIDMRSTYQQFGGIIPQITIETSISQRDLDIN